jgi:hypothetical protein
MVFMYSAGFQKRRQLMRQGFVVTEGEGLRVRFQEKIKRIDHGHLRDQIHLHGKMMHALGKYHARQEIALRVLLPVQKVRLRLDLQRIRRYRGAAMRRRPEANHLRREPHQAIVMIDGPMMQSDTYGHGRLEIFPAAESGRRATFPQLGGGCGF